MIEAYRIGVAIAFSGNVGAQIEALAKQFSNLDSIINTTKANVRELGAELSGLTTEGRQAAAAWRQAADAMKQAAGAARSARGAGAGVAGGSAAPRAAGGPSPAPVAGGMPAVASLSGTRPPISIPYADTGARALVPYVPPGALVPYWNGNTGFTTSGNPYTPYGWSTPGRPYQGGSGRGLVPVPPPGTGFTMPPGAPPTGVGPWGGWSPNTGWTWGAGGPPPGGVGGPPPPPGGPPVPYAGGGPGGGRGPIPLNYPAARQWGNYPAAPGLNGLAAIPAWMGGDLLKGIFERTATFDAVKAGLLGQGFTPEQANAAAEASFATQRNTLGTSALGNIDLVSKLMAVVQDPTEAIKLMPDYARVSCC